VTAGRQTPDARRQSEDRIAIRGIEVFARHGVLASEKEFGQAFLVDVELFLDLSKAALSDRLEDTVDYGELAQRIHDIVASERWDLIERVAGRVAEVGMQDRRVSQINVTVHKPEAPIAVSLGDVAVTLTRTRE
jgi:dihydroneopterin aldolase